MSTGILTVSLDSLMSNFRNALIEISSRLVHEGITIQDAFSGDAWDDTSEILFYYLVMEPLQEGLGTQREEFKMSKYEFDYKDYSKLSFIEVIPKSQPMLVDNKRYAFFNFSRSGRSFDKVNCFRLDSELKVMEKDIFFPSDKVEFQFQYLLKVGQRKMIREINLEK